MLHRIPVSVPITHTLPEVSDAERLARLHFHVRSGDYFPTLATFLGFIEETLGSTIATDSTMTTLERELVKSLRKDLMHLHQYYRIQPK